MVYYSLSATYNITLHSLAKFPGPKTAAISQIPYAIALVRGRLPQWVKELHDRYKSDVIRISPRELSFINAAAWNDINGHRIGHQDFDKDLAVYGSTPNGVHSILTAPRADHARMRRVLEHAFSVKAFREQEPVVVAYTDKLIRRLHEEARKEGGKGIDVVEWYNWMSFDIIGDLAFAESFKCLEDQRYHPWVQMVFGNLQAICFVGACDRFPLFKHLLPLFIPGRVKKMLADHWAYTADKISKRLKLEKDRPDFISPIVKNNTDGKGISQDEIQSNTSLFVIAGSESIATNLSGATYFLLKNPSTMQKLKEEVRSTFKSENEITVRSVSELPYVQAVLSEVNRIYPTALTGQACVVPPQGDTVCGQWIPGNVSSLKTVGSKPCSPMDSDKVQTGVSINQYAAYHSLTNFVDPETFVPERWLSDPRYVSDNQEVFHPFSYGPRNCIGKMYAPICLSIPPFPKSCS